MSFADPGLLQLGIGLAVLVAAGLWRHDRRRRWLAESLGGRWAAHRLAGSDLYRLRVERMVLLGLAALLLGAAAARPGWRTEAPPASPPPPPRTVVLAIDVSASMQAPDVSPTRLGSAVELAEQLLEGLEGERVGLVLFAGKAYPLAPPTFDHAALRFLLQGVSPETASLVDPGTLLAAALGQSARLVDAPEGAEGPRSVVLISDGDSGGPSRGAVAEARRAADRGIDIHAIGVGTVDGAAVTLPRDYRLGGPVVDARGVPVVSRLRDGVLREVAEAGGGLYAAGSEPGAVGAVLSELAAPLPEAPAVRPLAPWERVDPTVWLALGALLCLLAESLLDVRVPIRAAAPKPERRGA